MTAIIWGSAFVVVKNTTETLPVNYIICVRFLIAAFLIGTIFWKHLKKLNKTYWKNGIILGLFLYISFYLQTLGVKYTTAGKNAFLTAIYVVLVPFLYWIVKKKKTDNYNLIAAFFCIIGIGLISLNQDFTVNFGDLLSLLCGVAFCAQIVAVSIFTEKQDPILLSFLQFLVAGIFGLLGTVMFETLPSQIETEAILGLLYIGVFSSAIAFGLQTICQKFLSASKASLLMSLESVFGRLSGIIFLQETVTTKILIGFILIFAAVIISETKPSVFNLKRNQKPLK